MTEMQRECFCRACRYWQEMRDEDGTLLGLCRRAPPAYEGWPVTRPEDWCGEFAAALSASQ